VWDSVDVDVIGTMEVATGAAMPFGRHAHDGWHIELHRVGAGSAPGPRALDLLDLSRPTQSFVKPAESMGGAARRVHSAEEVADARRGAFIESRTAPN
jgi:acetolactate synthase I/II/III large subunit